MIGKIRLTQKNKMDSRGHQLPMIAQGIIIIRIPPARTMDTMVMMRIFLALGVMREKSRRDFFLFPSF
jgi:hypothetical protein